jgi:hypothetical protein
MSISRFSVDLVVTELAVIAFPGARDPRRNRAWCSQVIGCDQGAAHRSEDRADDADMTSS